MLVDSSKVRIDAEGIESPVRELTIADRIFNPITGQYDEITDILQREIRISDPCRDPLAPVLIEKGQLLSGRPRHDLALSPLQQVLVADWKRSRPGPPRVSCYPAREVSSDRVAVSGAVTYFAIFVEHRRFLDVGGILVQAYTLEDISHARFA